MVERSYVILYVSRDLYEYFSVICLKWTETKKKHSNWLFEGQSSKNYENCSNEHGKQFLLLLKAVLGRISAYFEFKQ